MMPYGDANAIVMDMAGEVLTIVEDTPVLAGVCGTDPFRQMDVFLQEVKIGFAGVQNFPTVGLIDGLFRQNLEETGMGYGPEVEMIRTAHQMDLLTTPYAFKPEEAEQMADAGADIVVAHMWTDYQRLYWRNNGLYVGRIRRSGAGYLRCGARRQSRCDCPVSRWTDLDAGRCRIRAAAHAGGERFLQRLTAWSDCP